MLLKRKVLSTKISGIKCPNCGKDILLNYDRGDLECILICFNCEENIDITSLIEIKYIICCNDCGETISQAEREFFGEICSTCNKTFLKSVVASEDQVMYNNIGY